MPKISLHRFAKFSILVLICIKVGILGYYLYGYGLKHLRIGHSQAIAEDKVKFSRPFSVEDLKGFELLETRRRELALKDEELKNKERELLALRKDVEERLDKLSRLQDQVQKNLEGIKQNEDARLKHLVGAYSSMKPDKAAGLIEKLDDEVALQILSAMKSKDVGGVLSYVNTEKAAKLSQRLAKQPK